MFYIPNLVRVTLDKKVQILKSVLNQIYILNLWECESSAIMNAYSNTVWL